MLDYKIQYIRTKRSGCYLPILLAPAEGWGALWALLGAIGLLFITIKLYFESEIPFLGACFIKLFDLRPLYICF